MDSQEIDKSNSSFNAPVSTTPTTPPPAASSTSSTSVEGAWPEGFGIFKYTRAAMKVNLSTYMLLMALVIPATIGANLLSNSENLSLALISSLVSSFAGFFSMYAVAFISLRGVENTKVSFGDIFNSFKKNILAYFILTIGVSLALMGSALLFIIPFFIVWPRTSLWLYALIDGDKNPFKTSWKMMKGNVRKFYNIFGAGVLVSLLFLTIIGIPFVIYWLIMYTPVYAVLYEYIKRNSKAAKV